MIEEDEALKEALKAITWPLTWGSVEVQIQEGKIVLVTVKKTLK